MSFWCRTWRRSSQSSASKHFWDINSTLIRRNCWVRGRVHCLGCKKRLTERPKPQSALGVLRNKTWRRRIRTQETRTQKEKKKDWQSIDIPRWLLHAIGLISHDVSYVVLDASKQNTASGRTNSASTRLLQGNQIPGPEDDASGRPSKEWVSSWRTSGNILPPRERRTSCAAGGVLLLVPQVPHQSPKKVKKELDLVASFHPPSLSGSDNEEERTRRVIADQYISQVCGLLAASLGYKCYVPVFRGGFTEGHLRQETLQGQV